MSKELDNIEDQDYIGLFFLIQGPETIGSVSKNPKRTKPDLSTYVLNSESIGWLKSKGIFKNLGEIEQRVLVNISSNTKFKARFAIVSPSFDADEWVLNSKIKGTYTQFVFDPKIKRRDYAKVYFKYRHANIGSVPKGFNFQTLCSMDDTSLEYLTSLHIVDAVPDNKENTLEEESQIIQDLCKRFIERNDLYDLVIKTETSHSKEKIRYSYIAAFGDREQNGLFCAELRFSYNKEITFEELNVSRIERQLIELAICQEMLEKLQKNIDDEIKNLNL